MPVEIELQIACFLSHADLRRLRAVTVHLYDVASTVLYHSIFMHDVNAEKMIDELLFQHDTNCTLSRLSHPMLYIHSLSYYSFTDIYDEERLPRLAHILRDSVNIDIVTLQPLGSSGVAVCQALYEGMHFVPGELQHDVLPVLKGVQTCSLTLLSMFLDARDLRVVMLEDGPSGSALLQFLPFLSASGRAQSMQSFGCTVMAIEVDTVLGHVAQTFQNLTHLCMQQTSSPVYPPPTATLQVCLTLMTALMIS